MIDHLNKNTPSIWIYTNSIKLKSVYLKKIKGIYEISTDLVLSGERLEIFPRRSETRQGVNSNHFCSTVFEYAYQGFKVN